MVTFEEIIGNLLLRHNCVVIPEFGGFVAKQSAAKIDFEKGIIHPPKKSILFNRQLMNNDGLMVNEYASSQQLSFEVAQSEIRKITSTWMADLHAGRRVSIDRVGYLFQDEEKNICFEQDRHFNLLLESFGLGQVHFIAQEDVEIVKRKIAVEDATKETVIPIHPTELNEPKKEVTEEQNENPFVQAASKKSRTYIWKYAAAIAAIPIVFYSIWIPMRTDVLESNMLSFKDFNPFNKHIESQYTAPVIVEKTTKKEFVSLSEQIDSIQEDQTNTFAFSLTENTYVLVDLEKKNTPTTAGRTETTIIANQSNGFNFIVGCFSAEANANSLVADLKKMDFKDAKILDQKNGLYRVTIGETTSQSQLDQNISKAKANGLDGWVLR